jgi:hypothetical protein
MLTVLANGIHAPHSLPSVYRFGCRFSDRSTTKKRSAVAIGIGSSSGNTVRENHLSKMRALTSGVAIETPAIPSRQPETGPRSAHRLQSGPAGADDSASIP